MSRKTRPLTLERLSPEGLAKMRARFEVKYTPEPNSGCWLWTGAVYRSGYGSFRIDTQATGNAHRVAWFMERGPLPQSIHLDHKCRVRLCVNPDHLEPVTQQENTRRGLGGVLRLRCERGHDLTKPGAFYVVGRVKKYRCCKFCRLLSTKRHYQKKKAERLGVAS